MDRFSKTHPIFQFVFFVCVFVLIVSVYNPVFAGASLLCGVLYDFVLRKKEAFKSLGFVLAIVFVVSLFNMLFAHYGVDVLFKIGNTEFTFQALFYGLYQGVMLASFLIWFGLFSRIVDSEKVTYLFRFSPKLALLFSMVLGFIPRFSRKLKEIEDAQLGLNPKKYQTKKERFKQGLSNLSALITYSFESSIVTSNSMEARGYNPRAVKPSRYKIKLTDIVLIMLALGISLYVIYSKLSEKTSFVFEPKTYFESFDVLAVILFCVLCLTPIIIDLVEGIKWKLSAVKA